MAIMPAQRPHRSKQDYRTPEDFLTAAKRRLGITAFRIDFAADADNRVADVYWDEATDALAHAPHVWAQAASGNMIDGRRYTGLWGWLNPPYTSIGQWAQMCYATKLAGGQVAFLVPAAVGSNWFLSYVYEKSLVLALNGRIPFIPEKPDWLYPKDLMLCLYSPFLDPGFDVWRWRDWI